MNPYVSLEDQIPGIMGDNEIKSPERGNIFKTSVDLLMKLGVLVLVVFFCFRILAPFINILLWAVVIAVLLFPVYERLKRWLGNRGKLAAVLLSLAALIVLLVPSYWLVDSVVDGVKVMAGNLKSGNLTINQPPGEVQEWPIIGEWVYDTWLQASQNIGGLLKTYMPQITKFGEKMLGSLAGTGLGILQFAFSLIIAGIFLTFSETASVSANRLFYKLAGRRGEILAHEAKITVRNVAVGALGVAILQSFLIGIPMFILNVPLAGIWIVIFLILASAQVPVMILTIPLVIYVIIAKEPVPAILWTAYILAASLVDNVLKPIVMGQGRDVPMLLIFLGAIGGFITFGLLGLFLGAIVLSLGYKLYITWVNSDD